jgi:hypothetical protein
MQLWTRECGVKLFYRFASRSLEERQGAGKFQKKSAVSGGFKLGSRSPKAPSRWSNDGAHSLARAKARRALT